MCSGKSMKNMNNENAAEFLDVRLKKYLGAKHRLMDRHSVMNDIHQAMFSFI